MMKKRRMALSLLLLTTTTNVWALIDIEAEIYAPIAEMKMFDDAMNEKIKAQRLQNANRPIMVEEDISFNVMAMLEFVLHENQYVLEKSVSDINNTTIKTKLENRMLTITETKKIEEVSVEKEVVVGSTQTEKKYFKSTTSETLSLPDDADEKTLISHYENGLLRVTVNQK